MKQDLRRESNRVNKMVTLFGGTLFSRQFENHSPVKTTGIWNRSYRSLEIAHGRVLLMLNSNFLHFKHFGLNQTPSEQK